MFYSHSYLLDSQNFLSQENWWRLQLRMWWKFTQLLQAQVAENSYCET
jgi:hypothetical protein